MQRRESKSFLRSAVVSVALLAAASTGGSPLAAQATPAEPQAAPPEAPVAAEHVKVLPEQSLLPPAQRRRGRS